MRRRRGVADERLLCSGPGRLCVRRSGITDAQYGLALDEPPLRDCSRTADVDVDGRSAHRHSPRAMDHPWRYGLEGSRFRQQAVSNGDQLPHSAVISRESG